MYFHDSHFECLQFKNSQDARKIEVARKNLYDTTHSGQQVAGDMYLELAFGDNLDIKRALSYLEIAGDCWKKSIYKSKYIDSHFLKSSIQFANLPAYESLLTETPADINKLEQTYFDIVEIANIAHEGLLQIHEKNSEQSRIIVGVLSEAIVLSLLQRFNLRFGNPEWTVLPSLISQDIGHTIDRDQPRNSWDISIFSHYDTTELAYKIQVKTAQNDQAYEDDISLVYLSNICGGIPLTNRDRGVSRLLL